MANYELKHDDVQERKFVVEVAVVLVPFPAQSHLNMLLNLCHLISSNNIPVHFASSTQHIHQVKSRCLKPETVDCYHINFHEFYLPSCDDLTKVHTFLSHLHKPISQLITDLSSKYPRIIVIHDCLMASLVDDVREIPNAEAFTFHTISAFAIFFNIWQAIPERPFILDHSNPHLPRWIPTVKEACHASDFAAFVNKQWKLSFAIEVGSLYNTSRVIDGTYIGLLEKIMPPHKKHYAVGPLLGNLIEKECGGSGKKHMCLDWLECQETDSVIYVSFGTTLSLPLEQIRELAAGLEKSGQKFLWVFWKGDKGDISLSSEDEGEEENKLLEEITERVGNRGLIVRDWAPQQEILGHPSVGGFLTHCGWGSLNESMTMGVPVVAWPMHSDQPMNSVLVTQVLKVGVLVREDFWESRGELITSCMVENSVRRLMATYEGEGMRASAKEISSELRGSIAEGGASCLDMYSFVAHMTRP